MSFADDLATQASDPRRSCGFETWLRSIDPALAAEVREALEAGTYGRSAIFRTIRMPKYGYPGSLPTLQRHDTGMCTCFAEAS